MRPTKEAIQLFHEGTVALAQVEANGIRIDEKYLKRAIYKAEKKIARMEDELTNDPIFKRHWKGRFGQKAKLGNKQQLEAVIFDDLGYTRSGRLTDSGEGYKADEKAFESIDLPFLYLYFRCEKWKKAHGYLLGTQDECVNGRIHPMIGLNMAVTYRSNAERPNIQNYPVRDEEIMRLIRQCIIADDGYVIGEIDYGGIEVCISACYHEDPMMVRYIEDPSTDMHRDLSMQCFLLKEENVSKTARYLVKNGFTFPQFYGSYYIDCAKDMWTRIDVMKIKSEEGILLRDHLKSKGIKKLGLCDPQQKAKKGTYEYLLQEVQNDFWNNRFKVYKQWKKDWWGEYLERGWFRLKTGFICQGRMDRKMVCNYPIQGAAFHCLLWSLIRLQNWLNKNKMKTKILAQIHDSLVIMFHKDEIEKVLKKAKQIMCEAIREKWKWIVVPLKIEVEIAPDGKSWADKEKVELP